MKDRQWTMKCHSCGIGIEVNAPDHYGWKRITDMFSEQFNSWGGMNFCDFCWNYGEDLREKRLSMVNAVLSAKLNAYYSGATKTLDQSCTEKDIENLLKKQGGESNDD